MLPSLAKNDCNISEHIGRILKIFLFHLSWLQHRNHEVLFTIKSHDKEALNLLVTVKFTLNIKLLIIA